MTTDYAYTASFLRELKSKELQSLDRLFPQETPVTEVSFLLKTIQ